MSITGTGTFIARLLQSGRIRPDDLLRKYTQELHANEILLLALTRYFAHTDETPEQLALLESVGVGLMFAAIKPIGQLLTTLPFGSSAPGRTAGPTFELFYIGGYLLPHRQAAWTLIAERLRQAAGLARRLEGEGLALRGVIAGLEKYATQLETA